MNKIIFLCISCALLIFSIIVICTGPIISGTLSDSSSWNDQNCQIYSDSHKYYDDDERISDKDIREAFLKHLKKGRNLCNRQKAMYGLEYSSFIIDVIIGFICALLSLLHFFGVGKDFEKNTALIGMICGVIGFILTLIYIIYSGYIFTNDGPGKRYGYSSSIASTSISHFSTSNGALFKLDKNRAIAQWDDSKNTFVCLYYEKDNQDSLYAKYKDIGKKQYNYHKDFTYTSGDNSEYDKCQYSYLSSLSGLESKCKNPTVYSSGLRPVYGNDNKKCEYLYYHSNNYYNQFSNKYLFDKWITTIIFGCFIIALNLGLIIFGFLLFKKNDL